MIRQLRTMFGRKGAYRASAPTGPDLPRPQTPTYVVGDLHGRADLLELMLELIDAHIGGTGGQDPRLVFVGDYIDHGPDSAAVLARLQELSEDFPQNVICLMGNHERMLLDTLGDPALRGPRWLREGGHATLQSYGIDPTALIEGATPALWAETATAMAEAMGPQTKSWLAACPLSWQSGNLWVVHAGADPARPMTDQTARVLLWGHPEFDSMPRADEAWVAHGHVVGDSPMLRDGRISLDTGAWSTGQLSCIAIQRDGSHAFLQT
jgi:serine/threonine protein phosphatase 1